MHACEPSDADLTIDGRHYKLDSLGECKTLSRLRGAKGVRFADYSFMLERLQEQHKRELRGADPSIERKAEAVGLNPSRHALITCVNRSKGYNKRSGSDSLELIRDYHDTH